MDILVTGAAGFIGFHLARTLLAGGHKVVGIDNLNDYYDVDLKHKRLELLNAFEDFEFVRLDIKDRDAVDALFEKHCFPYVVHLAAQAGVRYGIQNPYAYVDSNLLGFVNMLEACRHGEVRHFLFASSSSVYGGNTRVPFSTKHPVDHPVSLYAATKKSNELMAHAYSHLFGIPVTGLRFFTVYGPWGRPDMAYYLFTDAIFCDRPIDVFNHGKMERDFTYVDDAVAAVERLISRPPGKNAGWNDVDGDPSSSGAPYKIYNIGNNRPVGLERFIEVIEEATGKKAVKNYVEMQPGDVLRTFADVDDLAADIGFRPDTSIEEGVGKFVEWYRLYRRI